MIAQVDQVNVSVPENVSGLVLFALILVAVIVVMVFVTVRLVLGWIRTKLAPTNGRAEAAEKRGVATVGDQIYDIGADVGELRAGIAQLHGDVRDGFERLDGSHRSLSDRFEAHLEDCRRHRESDNERLLRIEQRLE